MAIRHSTNLRQAYSLGIDKIFARKILHVYFQNNNENTSSILVMTATEANSTTIGIYFLLCPTAWDEYPKISRDTPDIIDGEGMYVRYPSSESDYGF